MSKCVGTVQNYSQLFNEFVMENRKYASLALDFDDMAFLTDEGFLYYQDLSFKHAIDLILSYADSITLSQLLQEKPPLNVTQYAYRNYLAS